MAPELASWGERGRTCATGGRGRAGVALATVGLGGVPMQSATGTLVAWMEWQRAPIRWQTLCMCLLCLSPHLAQKMIFFDKKKLQHVQYCQPSSLQCVLQTTLSLCITIMRCTFPMHRPSVCSSRRLVPALSLNLRYRLSHVVPPPTRHPVVRSPASRLTSRARAIVQASQNRASCLSTTCATTGTTAAGSRCSPSPSSVPPRHLPRRPASLP